MRGHLLDGVDGRMRIHVHNEQRQPLFRVRVDPAEPPTLVHPPRGQGESVHLDWDRALDDEGHLRRCPVCGCEDLYVRKQFPQVTAFAVVIGAGVLAMLLFGFGYLWTAVGLLLLVVAVDALIFVFGPRSLVCYRCRSEFRQVPIGREHAGWDSTVEERHPTPQRQ